MSIVSEALGQEIPENVQPDEPWRTDNQCGNMRWEIACTPNQGRTSKGEGIKSYELVMTR